MECILNLVDPQFAATQGFKYRLSVLLCHDGFSFLVSHSITRKIMLMASYKLSPDDLLQHELGEWPEYGHAYFEKLKAIDLIRQQYQRTDIAIASTKLTVTPSDFLDSNLAPDMMTAVHQIASNEKIFLDTIGSQGPILAITIPGYLKEYCENIFPDAGLHSEVAIFVRGAVAANKISGNKRVFVNIQHEHFLFLVVGDAALQYLNIFKYSTPEDVAYFLLFVLEQLSLDVATDQITLSGKFCDNIYLNVLLKTYCGLLSYVHEPEELGFGEVLKGIAFYKYFTLLNIPLCE